MAGKMMVANRPMTYGTRRLKAGDEFQVKKDIHARLLAKRHKASPKRDLVELPKPPAALKQAAAKIAAPVEPALPVTPPAPPPPPDANEANPDQQPPEGPGADAEPSDPKAELRDLRKAFEEKFGKKPFMGWNADQIREKMAAEPNG